MGYKDPEAQRAYQRQWTANARAQALEGKSCTRCGSVEKLQFHHRDPAEKISHNVWSWTPARRAAELAKCDALCVECHREHHGSLLRRHGTVNRYSKGGCRCDLCKRAA